MKKYWSLFALFALILVQIVAISSMLLSADRRSRLQQKVTDSEQTLAFACGYLYGQANIAEVLGHPEIQPREGLVPSCRGYAERAAAGGFTEVWRALK